MLQPPREKTRHVAEGRAQSVEEMGRETVRQVRCHDRQYLQRQSLCVECTRYNVEGVVTRTVHPRQHVFKPILLPVRVATAPV